MNGHRHSTSVSQNHKAQLANAYNELGKELSSPKIRVVGNYTLGKVIGEGTYGKVRLGVHRLTGTRVAIKQIPKAMTSSLTREIHHHRQLHHPHITQLYEVIATESYIWLVTELCSGGELFDYLVEKARLDESETRIIFGQLCLAVAYVHSKGIVHRDLKLENVLLDEHCRVKLGDFGFTREFERGMLLETFCGTTGYASPEMLLAKKYLGPEVDVWSLGVILYTLLTGMLPFDDDDEDIMKQKVIEGEFEDPEWLSEEVRDLLKSILQTDPEKRPTIAQILAHPWFTTAPAFAPRPIASQSSLSLTSQPESPSPLQVTVVDEPQSSISGASDTTYHSTVSHFPASAPMTPQIESSQSSEIPQRTEQTPVRPAFPRQGSGTKAAPAYPTRTPVRTKRRSVSSALSENGPTFDKAAGSSAPPDFASLLNTPAPLIFSTSLERDLLNAMAALGLDTGQIVHSVLSDACDATGALWWLLKRKTEKRILEEDTKKSEDEETEVSVRKQLAEYRKREEKKRDHRPTPIEHLSPHVTDHGLPPIAQAHSAPELHLVPATPVGASMVRSATPPRAKSPNSALLSPSSSAAEISLRSHPSTPGGSLKDKDKDSGSKGRKGRSGSVSIMQRATTALEAAGLVRKKSAEVVKAEKDKEREKDANSDRRVGSGTGDESRTSHGSGSSKVVKSPPLKAKDLGLPITPPSSSADLSQTGSPWVIAGAKPSPPPPSTDSPRDTLSALPDISRNKSFNGSRNRASLLSAFRMWFKEDPKGKRKEDPSLTPQAYTQLPSTPSPSPVNGRGRGTMKRRVSANHGRYTPARQTGTRSKRASISSRRSSSVNSHRSSVQSAQVQMYESPTGYGPESSTSVSRRRSDASRRSFGSHTPNSEREDFVSRPSSIHSFTNQVHRKSPSASSAGSMHPARTASPLPRYHNRGGSASSTRVVRQFPPPPHLAHLRSNSTSSAQSRGSSRPGSLYEFSESDSRRNSSPHKPYPRRPVEEMTPRRSTFVAHKRQTPFSNPNGSNSYLNSFGRSSWKKSWGLEPPGWQNRSAYSAIEVLAISPPADSQQGIRDVFSGRQSLNMGDESDWVDEDDDSPAYAGGLGQTPIATAHSGSSFSHSMDVPALSPVPKGLINWTGGGKRAVGSSTPAQVSVLGRGARSKAGRSPVDRSSPLPSENTFENTDPRCGRRQLPTGRSGPAFRGHAIQEEDEGEEEET
ncbi:Pkinase-domain-containing protein [Laetiporus sulphureus 93-53]|uniref:non-specific serine/threonine protein kinase n=1 Tax=Laetiporus sulphureus 93-53 TaxID=1314785 RepID=A0A165CY15_9APHY|nr:Pkinase-domain-containing protein [Laetiporus sulphureus 93-53]KZT03715.1 Pkinase-domain-containing protein [Laetiporus sulphureus 93-53]